MLQEDILTHMKHVVAPQGQYVECIVVLNNCDNEGSVRNVYTQRFSSVQFSLFSYEPFFISINCIILYISLAMFGMHILSTVIIFLYNLKQVWSCFCLMYIHWKWRLFLSLSLYSLFFLCVLFTDPKLQASSWVQ